MSHCPHCGCDIAKPGKARSVAQLRRFFGVLRAMYRHWPEGADYFQPDNEEHLRKWVIAKAGYRDSTDIAAPFCEDEPAVTRLLALSIEAAIRATGGYAFVRPHPEGGSVRVYKAKSIAFDAMGPAEFTQLNDAVEAVYRSETGLDPDEVLKEDGKAA